jgi:hypothetical protein
MGKLTTKNILLVTFSFLTLGIGLVAYGLFYKLPNLIINSALEERKFQQFLEEIEEDIRNEFLNIKNSIEYNIKSYKNIVTKSIKRFYEVIRADKNKNDENWKNAKKKYQIIYSKFKSIKNQ